MEADLGERILAYLERDDRSQRFVAHKLGYTPSAFSKWISGINPMPVEAIRGFCDLFSLSDEEYVELLKLAGHNVIGGEGEVRSHIKLVEQSTTSNPLTFETTERFLTIGRAPKNSIQIPNQQVSWEHGQIILMQGSYFYRHLSKSNPSILRRKGEEYLLEPQGIVEIELRNQDRLTIGDRTFIIEFDLMNEDRGYITTAKGSDGAG